MENKPTYAELENQIAELKDQIDLLKMKSLLDNTSMDNFFGVIVENLRDGINVLDLKTNKYIYMNSGQIKLTGFTRDEINNITAEEVYERVHPDDRDISISQHKLLAEGLEMNEPVEYRWKVKSGEYRWFSDSRKQIYDANGIPVALVGMCRDITDKKATEQVLIENKELLYSIYDNVPALIGIINKNFEYIYVNKKVIDVFGKKQNEIIGKHVKETIGHEAFERAYPFALNALNGETYTYDNSFPNKDGNKKYVQNTIKPFYQNNEITGILTLTIDISQLKNTEQALFSAIERLEKSDAKVKEQARLLDIIFAHTMDSIVILDKDYNFIKVSQSYAISCQKDISEFTEKNLFEVYPYSLKDEFDECKKNKTIYYKPAKSFESPGQPELGLTYCDLGLVPILNETGEIQLFLLTLKDVTKNVYAQTALKESEEKFHIAFHSSPLPLSISLLETGEFIEANNAFFEITEYSKEEVIGFKSTELSLWDNETRKEILAELNHSKSIKNKEVTMISKSKKLKYLLWSCEEVTLKNRKCVIVTVIDITKSKLDEKALKESEKAYKDVVETTTDLITVVDTDGKLIFANHATLSFFGLTPKECIGRMAFNFIHPDDVEYTKNKFSEWLSSGEHTFYLENRQININNKVLYVAWNINIERENNRIIKITSIARDISERKQAELLVQQKNKELQELNSDKDRFISILSHDLKNPFNSLLGFSDLLVKNVRAYDIDKIEKQLLIINKTIHKTFHLLEDLLLWSNSQSGKLNFSPQISNFNDICIEIISHIQNHADIKGISINCHISENVHVFVDVNMIKTILRNLITNAVKFTNPNGFINVYSEKENNYVIITVADNGIGIPQDIIPQLWETTYKHSTAGTKGETGTGLGLMLCKEFIEKNGGKIWVESEVGVGSEFKFTIPLDNF